MSSCFYSNVFGLYPILLLRAPVFQTGPNKIPFRRHSLPFFTSCPCSIKSRPPFFWGPGCEPALFLSGISPVEVLFRQLSSIAKTTGKASGMSRAYYGQYPFRGMVYVLISLLSVNKSMYFETYLIPNVVLFQLYVPLYLLFISTHCVIVTV